MRKKEYEVPRIFEDGESVQLLICEDLPERHISRDYFVNSIFDNPAKARFLGKEVTISGYEFSPGLEEWMYSIKEDGGKWLWLDDMFLHAPVVPKEKGKNMPQMPNL